MDSKNQCTAADVSFDPNDIKSTVWEAMFGERLTVEQRVAAAVQGAYEQAMDACREVCLLQTDTAKMDAAEECFKAIRALTSGPAQPSDELSFDEALLKKVTDAYAARFPIPAGYSCNEVVEEVVKLIAVAPGEPN